MSELLLVSIPGVEMDEQGALLRVVLVPRLGGPGTTLEDYGMADWPALVADAEVEIQLYLEDGYAMHPITTRWRSAGVSEVWSAFFSKIAVKPYTGQQTYDDPVVTPTAKQAGQIDAVYLTAAQQVGDPEVVREQVAALDLGEAPPPPGDAAKPSFEQPDFHRAIALLREFPAVLKALGLIVELTVPAAELEGGASGEVSVNWPNPPAGIGSPVSLRTAYAISDGQFLPAPTETIVDGLVDLSKEDWEVTTLDVDGAVSRLGDAQTALAENADEGSLPALRTSGLMLVRRNRSDRLAESNKRAKEETGQEGSPLTADDLALGYRVDVREQGREWRSLTQRVAEYGVDGVQIGGGPIAEEGHVKPAAAVIGGDGVLRADEVVVRWSGWNLAIPRPAPGGSQAEPRRIEEMPYDFTWEHKLDPEQPPVPALRFGTPYQLRARIVDLAGGGLKLDPRGEAGASAVAYYRRYEPLAPPEIPPPAGLLQAGDGKPQVDHEALGPGGSLDVLVLRSDPRGEPPDDGLQSYPPNDSRLLLPAAATFTLAEHHGKLAGEEAESWQNARRALSEPQASSEARNGRHYTWLPDPAAQGVSLFTMPWTAGSTTAAASVAAWDEKGGAWPDLDPKTLIVKPGESQAAIVAEWADATTAELRLPAGQQADVEVSSALDHDFLDRLATTGWLEKGEAGRDAATSGRHPVITPARRLHVVHAVRKPLADPLAELVATRIEGATDALVADPAEPLYNIDRNSTAQVDVSSRWEEWGDAAEPEVIEEVLEVMPVGLEDESLPPILHEFADTKHREITYTLSARSRFRQYFDADEPDAAFVASTELGPVRVPSTRRPPPPEVLSVVPAFTWQESDDGTTLTRTRGGGRLRIELGGPWHVTGEGERLGLIVEPGAMQGELTTPAGEALVPVDREEQPTLFTTAYRDPLYGSPLPGAQPTSETVSGLAGEIGLAWEPGSSTVATIAPYAVWYAEDRKFADITFPELAETSYNLFVRLSLARYQPYSLPGGLELSTLVKPDPVQLLPDRTLIVERTDAGPVVTLVGCGPESPNSVEVRLEAATGENATELTVLSPEAGLAGWQPVTSVSGDIGIPLGPIEVPADGRPHRLVIRETEHLNPSSPSPPDPLADQLNARTVFADVVALS